MTVVASAEAPAQRLMARIRQLGDGRYCVDAQDAGETWTTEPLGSLDEAWAYVEEWFIMRGVTS